MPDGKLQITWPVFIWAFGLLVAVVVFGVKLDMRLATMEAQAREGNERITRLETIALSQWRENRGDAVASADDREDLKRDIAYLGAKLRDIERQAAYNFKRRNQ